MTRAVVFILACGGIFELAFSGFASIMLSLVLVVLSLWTWRCEVVLEKDINRQDTNATFSYQDASNSIHHNSPNEIVSRI